ncbi:hypothetical protein [Neomegalonema perideroedes]|uniref:hypothetical protein n=1 Tax=Neomegalonema perideroedes TaxID=217219 RepID=UPI00037C7DDF|nr:hypothetical protein [Neomegalonema perideroedes]
MLILRAALLSGGWMLLSGAAETESAGASILEKLYVAGFMLLCAALFGGGGDGGDWGDGDD